MILESQEILRGRSAMHVRHATNWCPGKVHGHRYSIFLGQVADLVRFQDAARCRKIRVNLADGMPFAQHAKRLFLTECKDPLASTTNQVEKLMKTGALQFGK